MHVDGDLAEERLHWADVGPDFAVETRIQIESTEHKLSYWGHFLFWGCFINAERHFAGQRTRTVEQANEWHWFAAWRNGKEKANEI